MLPMEELSRRQKMTPEQREKERETQRRWYLNNIEKVRKTKRESMKRRRDANPELAREKQKEWRNKRIDECRSKLRTYTRRRFFWSASMHLRQENRATYKELARLYRGQKGHCALSGRKLQKGLIHLDHIVPLSKGGTDEIENLRWVCKDANLAKRALTDNEFIQLCCDVAKLHGNKNL